MSASSLNAAMPEVFASLGSNQNREHNMRSAVRALEAGFGELRCSPVYLNKTVGFDGDDFLNMVVSFQSGQGPEEIQKQFRYIEDEHGRVRGEKKFAPRELDIDLILYGDLVYSGNTLSLPRADIEQYAFVLKPLADLHPEGIHPVLHKSFAQMWQEYDGDQDLVPFPLDFNG